MSEPIGMELIIGGDLPKRLANALYDAIDNEVSDLCGPSLEELRAFDENEPVSWGGTSHYGQCDEAKAFCVKHKLPYIHKVEGNYEYNASAMFWMPGMKEEVCVGRDGDSETASVAYVKPLCELLLAIVEKGPQALPAYVGHNNLGELVEKLLKAPPDKMAALLAKEIETRMPELPTLPPFRLT